jgi:hypothetical protein
LDEVASAKFLTAVAVDPAWLAIEATCDGVGVDGRLLTDCTRPLIELVSALVSCGKSLLAALATDLTSL